MLWLPRNLQNLIALCNVWDQIRYITSHEQKHTSCSLTFTLMLRLKTGHFVLQYLNIIDWHFGKQIFLSFLTSLCLFLPIYFTCRKKLMQLITINTLTHSVGLFWTMVRTIAETSTWLHTTHSMDRHPCPQQDSKLQSQRMGGRSPTPYAAWPLGSAWVFLTQTKIIFGSDVLLSVF